MGVKVSFEFKELKIKGVILIIPKVFDDNRGFFVETYNKSDFKKNGVDVNFAQTYFSNSKKNVLRGLHYQLNPYSQAKLIRVIKGSIVDVVVDIRKNSPTYGEFVSVKLDSDSKQMLFVPEGFAHGFYVLEDDTEVSYKLTKEYNFENERGIIWNDAELGIKWPDDNPILSEKDSKYPLLKDAYNNFENN
jgi:dTDP-4-dehydrorhamnose 3,5-epimerase